MREDDAPPVAEVTGHGWVEWVAIQRVRGPQRADQKELRLTSATVASAQKESIFREVEGSSIDYSSATVHATSTGRSIVESQIGALDSDVQVTKEGPTKDVGDEEPLDTTQDTEEAEGGLEEFPLEDAPSDSGREDALLNGTGTTRGIALNLSADVVLLEESCAPIAQAIQIASRGAWPARRLCPLRSDAKNPASLRCAVKYSGGPPDGMGAQLYRRMAIFHDAFQARRATLRAPVSPVR